jgi:endo-1,4-beta-xylanase
MQRRQAVFAAGLGLAQAALAQPQANATASLNTLAMQSGRRFGFAIDPSYAQLPFVKALLAHAGVFTAENAMKWAGTNTAPDRWNFSKAEAIVAQARSQGAIVRGHALAWHQSMPGWVSTTDKDAYMAAMTAHVNKIAQHFAGQIDTWDVLNEVVNPDDKRSDGMRDSVLSRLWGIDQYPMFFEMARAADPKARLAYNDYNLEHDLPGHERRRSVTLKMLETWVKRGTPIDVLGIQSHLHSTSPLSERKLSNFFDEVRALGLTIQITELDVRDSLAQGDIGARDASVASMYKAFADVCLSHPAVEMIVLWNVTDADTWFNKWSLAPKRADGLPWRPTLFDELGQPKPAYQDLRQSLMDAKTPFLPKFLPKEKKNV